MTTVLLEWDGGSKKFRAGPLMPDDPLAVFQELLRQGCDHLLATKGEVKGLKWSVPLEQWT